MVTQGSLRAYRTYNLSGTLSSVELHACAWCNGPCLQTFFLACTCMQYLDGPDLSGVCGSSYLWYGMPVNHHQPSFHDRQAS